MANVALASAGATITATSQLNTDYPASGMINGSHTGTNWGAGGSWLSVVTSDPQTIEINFNQSRYINRIDVYSVFDSPTSTATPTLTDTWSQFGLKDFTVEYWNGTSWVNIATVTGNNKVWRQFFFDPVSTTKIRIVATAKGEGSYYASYEIEAYTTPDLTAPSGSIISDLPDPVRNNVNVSVSAMDNVALASARLKVDGVPVGSSAAMVGTADTETIVLNPTGIAFGSHSLTALITDAAGNTFTTDAVSFTYAPPARKVFPFSPSGWTHSVEYSTSITEGKSGRESRNANWQEGRCKWDCSSLVKSKEDARKLIAFQRTCKGAWKSFLVFDYHDHSFDWTKTVETGNGARTVFQLQKIYEDDFGDQDFRSINKPIQGKLSVRVGGITLTEDDDYTVNYETGKITFAVAPANLAVVEAKGEFYVLARFVNDEIPVELMIYYYDLDDETREYYQIPAIPLIEVKV